MYNEGAIFTAEDRGYDDYPAISWTYLDETNQSYIDNTTYYTGLPSGEQEWEYYGRKGRVFESLNGTVTNTTIGSGKTNTANMLALRNGVYNQGPQIKERGSTHYTETCWYICDQFNKGTYSFVGTPVTNNTGCDDWYIPSKDELSVVKDSIGAENLANLLWDIDLTPPRAPQSSSSCEDIRNSWAWLWISEMDRGVLDLNKVPSDEGSCLLLIRSF